MGSWSPKEKFFEDGTENGDYNENVTVMAITRRWNGITFELQWATRCWLVLKI